MSSPEPRCIYSFGQTEGAVTVAEGGGMEDGTDELFSTESGILGVDQRSRSGWTSSEQ